MTVAALLTDPKVVPKGLSGDDRTLAQDYVRRRVRILLGLNPSLQDPAKAGDITAAATSTIAQALAVELPEVKTAFDEVYKRVKGDVARGLHVVIDRTTLRKRVSDRPPTGDPATMRRRLVLSIVYQAAAHDLSLRAPANVERLHRVCDRRLRIVERMLYDVGRYPRAERGWSRRQIDGHPGGPWTDGLERAFEYPRVPRPLFEKACAADAQGKCTGAMVGWELGDDGNIVGVPETSPGTTARWRPKAGLPYELDYTSATAGAPLAVAAITDLFTTSPDYHARNHLYCDQTIHALHLEALVFAEGKRATPAGSTAWLDGLVKANPAGWLRLWVPMPSADATDRKYLAGPDEPTFFEHTAVAPEDLQVGDHLIMYNHPAYEHATIHGAWRLENAVVVQTAPKLVMQGHGSELLTLASAKALMLKYFNDALAARRADIGPLAAVRSSGPATITVDTVARLATGMHIDVVDARTEAPVARDLVIAGLDRRRGVIQYAGTAVNATSAHVVRRHRLAQFGGKFEAIELGPLDLLRRVPAGSSDFAAPHNQLADWHVAWLATPEQDAIRRDAARAKLVKELHRVDFTVETDGTNTRTVGWFPLWEPARGGGAVPRAAGKISAIQPVKLGPDDIAAWTWFVDPDVSKRLVPVVRPRVP